MHILKPGHIVGNRYRVKEKLASGGSGIVYLVEDIKTGEIYALKEFFPHRYASRRADGNVLPKSESYAKAFCLGLEHFARISKKLISISGIEGLVRCEDYAEENGTAYLVMECVPGDLLKRRMERGVMRPGEVCSIAVQLIAVLERLDEHGLIHRDISPDNIMLDQAGRIHLIDCGNAVVEGCEIIPTGMKTRYTAPERVKDGTNCTVEAEIYSIGVLMGELLECTAEKNSDLEAIVSRSMATEAADRYRTYGELESEIRNYVSM